MGRLMIEGRCETMGCARKVTTTFRGRRFCGRCFEEVTGSPVTVGDMARSLGRWVRRAVQ